MISRVGSLVAIGVGFCVNIGEGALVMTPVGNNAVGADVYTKSGGFEGAFVGLKGIIVGDDTGAGPVGVVGAGPVGVVGAGPGPGPGAVMVVSSASSSSSSLSLLLLLFFEDVFFPELFLLFFLALFFAATVVAAVGELVRITTGLTTIPFIPVLDSSVTLGLTWLLEKVYDFVDVTNATPMTATIARNMLA